MALPFTSEEIYRLLTEPIPDFPCPICKSEIQKIERTISLDSIGHAEGIKTYDWYCSNPTCVLYKEAEDDEL